MNETESVNKKCKIPTWREILKRLPNARNDWRQRRPLAKFYYLYGIGRMGMDAIAFPTFQNDQRLKLYSFFGFVYCSVIYVLIFYTICLYVNRGEFAKALPCTCMYFGAGISALSFLVPVLTKQRFLLHSLVDFCARYIYRDHHDDIEYQRICSRHLDKTMKRFLTKMMMITLGFTMALMGPIYAFMVHGIRTTTVNVAVPYTEEKSWSEFMVNVVLQMLPATHGALFYLGGEVVIEIFSNAITITPHLIKHKLRKIISDNAKGRLTPLQLRLAIIDFVKQCNDSNEYVRNVSSALYWRRLTTPFAFFYSIGMSIFCQYMFGFAAGYGIAFMSWSQLFYFCELGESITNNGFTDILYDSDWYLLPTEFQKIIIFLIKRQQNVMGLSIGPFGSDLNREFFKDITKKIYSFVMFLLRFNN